MSVSFEHAEHMICGSTCDALPFHAAIGVHQLCSEHVWDLHRAHALTNHFTTSFLLAVLQDDADAASALEPDAAGFPGARSRAQGL